MDGVEYKADRFASGGTAQVVTNAISGATDDAVYQSERYATYKYEIPVTNANYSVVLHFAELYHSAAGARSFNLSVEGKSALSNVDLFSLAGQYGAYDYVVEDVTVTDKSLTLDLTSVVDNATISGFAIYSNNGGKFEEPPEPVCTTAER